MFKKYLQLFFNKDLITDATFLKAAPVNQIFQLFGIHQSTIFQNINIILSVILLLSILFAFGIFRYITPLLLYISVEIVQRAYPFILNGGDNLLKFLLLYMIFTDCYRYFTLNNSTEQKKDSISYFVNQISVLSIKIHLSLIYFVSAIFKFNAKVWFSGVATYYTLQLERFKGTEMNNILAKNGIFVTLSTYITLIWELAFPFLAWHKTGKYVVFALGILIHLGIYIFMMIHDFEILFMMCYGFFISDEEWKKAGVYFQKIALLFKRKIFSKEYA
ncbi:hypothetical protein CQ022_00490 [Chryseobacterium culicis]|uniref:HTTM-like domain-containing protein n=1 Tax=Chryseobacterium culicis TaxID=680127 RepID=A0A2S9CWG7_CHRCI|nr:hypothetical protein CQ022_00490 [Chryseobacterium culicis]PRB87801.1 hypothetical protein CQ033_20385 [Chryseobacterium culicis]